MGNEWRGVRPEWAQEKSDLDRARESRAAEVGQVAVIGEVNDVAVDTSTNTGAAELLTAGEVAAFLRTTRTAVYALVERGQLPGVVRLGRRVLFRRDELRAHVGLLDTGPSRIPPPRKGG